MKKNLLTTAFLVVTTAFIGCSSDENLAELQGGDPVPAKGDPITVIVTDEGGDATRYTPTTTSSLTNFYMWCYNITKGEENFPKELFSYASGTGNSRKFNSQGGSWPATKTDVCNFYAVSVNSGEDFGENFIFTNPPYDSNHFLKFDYSMPTKATKETVGIPDTDELSLTSGTIVPSQETVIDIDNTEDLLVSKNTNVAQQTLINNSSAFSMDFKHALCGVEISARFTSAEWQGSLGSQTTGVDEGAEITINYIALHGLYTSATYNMSEMAWDFSGLSTSNKYDAYYRFGFGASGKKITAQAVESAAEKIKRKVLVDDNTLLLIPQAVLPWDAAENSGIGSGDADGKGMAYIEINCTFKNVDGFNDGEGGSFFLPLKFSVNNLEAGKKYKLLINLNNLLYESGQTAGDYDAVFGNVEIQV